MNKGYAPGTTQYDYGYAKIAYNSFRRGMQKHTARGNYIVHWDDLPKDVKDTWALAIHGASNVDISIKPLGPA